jgi:hypothetical protein
MKKHPFSIAVGVLSPHMSFSACTAKVDEKYHYS